MGRAHEVRAASMAATAAKKTKLYSFYGKEIYQAAKTGGPDPDANLSLRAKGFLTIVLTNNITHGVEIKEHCTDSMDDI